MKPRLVAMSEGSMRRLTKTKIIKMRMLTKIFLVFNILGGTAAQVALPDGKICTILAKISENNSILEIMCGCSVQNFHTFDQISIFSPSLPLCGLHHHIIPILPRPRTLQHPGIWKSSHNPNRLKPPTTILLPIPIRDNNDEDLKIIPDCF